MTTSDDRLLVALAGVVRSRSLDPEQRELERLLHGDMADTELRQLQVRAESDAALAAALPLHLPLSAAAQARIVARLSQVQAAESVRAPATYARTESWWAALRAALSRKPMLLALASAAAVCLFVAWPRHDVQGLPVYQLEARTSDLRYRGDNTSQAHAVTPSAAPLVLTPGAQILLHMRPATPADQPPSVRALLAVRNGSDPERVVEWPSTVRASKQGALSVQLSAAPAELNDQGHARLILILASPANLDRLSDPTTGLAPMRTRDAQRWSLPLSPVR